jgi:hypothetical protein
MSNDCSLDRAPRVDVEIARRAIEAFRPRDNQVLRCVQPIPTRKSQKMAENGRGGLESSKCRAVRRECLGWRTLYRCMMGCPFRCRPLVTSHLCPHTCAIHCLQLRRKRPGRIGRENFEIFILMRCLPDPHGSDEIGTPGGSGALDLKTSIFEMHIASEQQVS